MILTYTLAIALGWRQSLSDSETALIHLARSAVQAEVLGNPRPHSSTHTPPRAVFVTIERKGTVIGCRGDLTPRTGTLEDEVVLAAAGAAKHDPRYKPLQKQDLNDFLVTVTVVEGMERLASVDGLRPSDGLVLEAGARKGIVLPWEGKEPSVRLRWAYQKAGVPLGSEAILYRLIATRSRG